LKGVTVNRQWMVPCLVTLGIAWTAPPAQATSSFECSIEDRSVTFAARSSVSDGLGQAFVGFAANADIRMPNVPEDMRKLDLSGHLVHHWIEAGGLRLRFYWERSGGRPHASVELILETTGEPEGLELAGTYSLAVFTMDPPANAEGGKTITAQGKAACSLG
jgi:hypothetical protein